MVTAGEGPAVKSWELACRGSHRQHPQHLAPFDTLSGHRVLRRVSCSIPGRHSILLGEMASKPRVPPGSKIGPYEVVTLLGAGGMGEVYKGHDPRLGRHVAIKVLIGEFASTPDRLRRFELEARSAAALSHPNILSVYDVGAEGDMPYVVSEFLGNCWLLDRSRCGRRSTSRSRLPAACRRRTRAGSCIATSSPRTSS
jgi:hypothetical protein